MASRNIVRLLKKSFYVVSTSASIFFHLNLFMFSVVLITKTNSLRGQVALPATRLQGPIEMKYTRWSELIFFLRDKILYSHKIQFTIIGPSKGGG